MHLRGVERHRHEAPDDDPAVNDHVADGPLRNYYPAWFAATGCGPTDYDLQPGRSVKTGEFVMPYTGTLLGVGGHLHDYGRRLLLENITRSEAIATLTPKLDSDGQMLSVPTVSFTTASKRPLTH